MEAANLVLAGLAVVAGIGSIIVGWRALVLTRKANEVAQASLDLAHIAEVRQLERNHVDWDLEHGAGTDDRWDLVNRGRDEAWSVRIEGTLWNHGDEVELSQDLGTVEPGQRRRLNVAFPHEADGADDRDDAAEGDEPDVDDEPDERPTRFAPLVPHVRYTPPPPVLSVFDAPHRALHDVTVRWVTSQGAHHQRRLKDVFP